VKRRDFLTQGTAVAGLAGSAKLVPPLMADQSGVPKPAPAAAKAKLAQEEIRSAEYLRRAREDKFLTKPPAFRESDGPADVPVSPMPLAERVKRKIRLAFRHEIAYIGPFRERSILVVGMKIGNPAKGLL
jgi:hypothetical protein